jgi:TPR repeat protein
MPRLLENLAAAACGRHIDYAAGGDEVYAISITGSAEDKRLFELALWFIAQGEKAAPRYGIRLLQQLADGGLTAAMHNLALAKLKGLAIERDEAGANALFCEILASEHRDTTLRREAMSAMADSYRLGRAVPVDMQAALELYNHAAELGMGRAAFNAGLIFENAGQGKHAAPDFGQAARFYQMAADLGYVPARTNLGVLHAAGLVADADRERGLALLRTAIADGDDTAGAALSVFEKDSHPAAAGAGER